ncbi:hypothetical protein WMY93_021280 [Mugilogobius chulae]|uniref:Pleiotrophin n=1 Tax=Mugilogobius chulae TaxID=88201 RepID=A0AAW0NBG0_9GOBI
MEKGKADVVWLKAGTLLDSRISFGFIRRPMGTLAPAALPCLLHLSSHMLSLETEHSTANQSLSHTQYNAHTVAQREYTASVYTATRRNSFGERLKQKGTSADEKSSQKLLLPSQIQLLDLRKRWQDRSSEKLGKKERRSDCGEWQWSVCVANEGDCGLGTREGTRTGTDCKQTIKTQRCKIPCNWKKKFGGECKYEFDTWGECDLATGKKNRTGVLKRALMDATCVATVTVTKPCGKIPKTKLQVSFALFKQDYECGQLPMITQVLLSRSADDMCANHIHAQFA